MKILLVVQRSHPRSLGLDNVILFEPLALEYIGAGVKENHDVKLLDLRAESVEFTDIMESFKPDIVACGAYTADVYGVKQILAQAKKTLPGVVTVVGGQHATVMPSDFFDTYIDFVVIGEGVEPFKRICEAYEKTKGFSHIKNIYYRANGKMVFTERTDPPPLDNLPFPARTLTSHLRKRYNLFFGGDTSFSCMTGSLGCTHRCKFCAASSLMNHKIYRRRIDNIVKELGSLEEPYVFWVDHEFLINPERALLLSKEVSEAGIRKKHWCYARSDTIVEYPETIEEWAKNGLQVVLIGLESHREKDLAKMGKDISLLSKHAEAVRICHANDVLVRGNFIVQPDFAKDDFRKLAEFSRELGVDIPGFTIWTPLPGTELYEEEKDNICTDNYELYDLAHTLLPTQLPLKQFYREYCRLYARGSSFKVKMQQFKRMGFKTSLELFPSYAKFFRRIKNAYKDHQEAKPVAV